MWGLFHNCVPHERAISQNFTPCCRTCIMEFVNCSCAEARSVTVILVWLMTDFMTTHRTASAMDRGVGSSLSQVSCRKVDDRRWLMVYGPENMKHFMPTLLFCNSMVFKMGKVICMLCLLLQCTCQNLALWIDFVHSNCWTLSLMKYLNHWCYYTFQNFF